MFKSEKGFTLIEILLVIGLIAILAAIVIIAINPARQFAQARNTQRSSDVNAILNAVHQNMVENQGVWTCSEDIPTTSTGIKATGTDIYSCLVDTYLAELPLDPVEGYFTSETDYDSGYEIMQSGTTGRVTVSAPEAELGETISVTR
jgi:prepilin-type N-terminal cleavage/methylation domain-containing protein